ncbi:uncharacterized protein LOC131891494 isoform X2 [Tigriopus californicus]|nr:uncharacterized protein LOC131891494 isoform X2 [Tigriopus californicus]
MVFEQDTGECYLGSPLNGSVFDETSSANSLKQTTIWMKTEKMPLFVANQFHTLNSVNGTVVDQMVFKMVSTNDHMTADLCHAHCVFDRNSNCHFTVMFESKCYLCELNATDPLNINLPVSVDIDIFKYAPGLDQIIPALYGGFEQMDKFVHYVVTIEELSLEACWIACIFTPYCHFIKVEGTECGLGSLEPKISANATMSDGDGFIYIRKDEVALMNISNYDKETSLSSTWSQFSFKSFKNVTSIQMCSVICALIDFGKPCMFFSLIGENCRLGAWEHVTGWNINPPVHTNVYLSQAYDSHLMFEVVETIPDWKNKIFLKREEVKSVTECELICVLSPRGCSLYSLDGSNCYLGDWNVDTSDVLLQTPSSALFGYEEVAYTLNTRPVNATDIPFTLGHEVALRDQKACVNTGLPNTWNQTENRGQVTAFSHPILLTCGGLEFDDVRCYKLDVTAQERAWEPAAELPMTMEGFAMPVTEDGDIYLFGGCDKDGSNCNAKVYRYIKNATVGSWLEVVVTDQNLLEIKDMCVVEHAQTFYIMGGWSDTAIPSSNVYALDYANSMIKDELRLRGSVTQGYCGKKEAAGDKPVSIFHTGGTHEDGVPPMNIQFFEFDGNGSPSGTGTRMIRVITNKTYTGGVGTNSVLTYKTGLAYFLPLWINGTEQSGTSYNALFNVITNSKNRFDMPDIAYASGQAKLPTRLLWTCMPQTMDWILILNHDNTKGISQWFSKGQNLVGNPDDQLYSAMDQVDSFKSCTGDFHFRMVWPELGYYNEWWQSSGPLATSGVQDYRGIAVRFPEKFIGLQARSGPESQMIGGDPADGLWSALGATQPTNGDAMPGPKNNLGNGINVKYVQLFVLKDC